MQELPPQESRKTLDAMGIPVVVLRDRQPDAMTDVTGDHSTAEASLSMAQSASKLAKQLASESTVDSQAIQFTIVSAVSDSTLLACELPKWAGGLLEGRLTELCSDLMCALSPKTQESDWQYFHWPIAGIKNQGESAAIEALDAWLHRRSAAMIVQDPTIVLAVSQLDLSSIFADALILPTLDELAVSADRKRHAWHVVQESRRA